MIGPVLELVARAWRWVRASERGPAPVRCVPDGIVMAEPDSQARLVREIHAAGRRAAEPGQIVICTNVSMFADERFERCQQCAALVAVAGDWPPHVFVVCASCGEGMRALDLSIQRHASSVALERARREHRDVPIVVRRH